MAKLAVLLIATLIFPLHPAQASVSFDAPSDSHPTALSTLNFNAWQATLDGTTIVAATKGYLLRSTDSGTTWSAMTAAGIKYWSAIAINDSGTVIVAAESGGGVWLSTNSGISFTLQSNGIGTSITWTSLDTNASGSVIVASFQGSSFYISTNTGGLWTPKTISGVTQIGSILMSGSGTRMALISKANSTLYISSDTGTVWTPKPAAGVVASSPANFIFSNDGQRILFKRESSLYLSKTVDFGATWETLTTSVDYTIALSASDDLSSIIIGPNGGYAYYSTNSGTSWYNTSTTGAWRLFYINQTSTRWLIGLSNNGVYTSDGAPSSLTYRPINLGISNWYRSAISNDGSVLVVSSYGGEISTSQDGGITWSSIGALGRNATWNCVAVSGNGNVVYVGGIKTQLWKSVDRGVTFSALSGTNLPNGTTTIHGCTTNNDGTKVVLSNSGGGLYLSSNSGGSFSLIKDRNSCPTYYDFLTVAMSNDGTKLATACNTSNSYLLVSTNSGVTWETTTVTSPYLFREIKSSSDGSVLMAVFNGTTYPKISKDWGSRWETITTLAAGFANALSINSDGSLIVIGQNSSIGSLYFSENKGSSFSQITGTPTGNYVTAALSGNSTKLIFGTEGNFLGRMSLAFTYNRASFSSLTLSAAAAYRTQVTLSATIASAAANGKVTFFANGKKISGCINLTTSSLVATCAWKPSVRGAVTLSATAYPADSSYLSGSISVPVAVTKRTGNR